LLPHSLSAHAPRYGHLLGPTPLVAISLDGDSAPIWCKLEFLNPSGSTKDRIARYILEKAWRQGRIHQQTLVAEASSGSTSIAFALACAQMGIRFIAFMPEGVSQERIWMIKAYGAEVRLTPRAEGIHGSIAATRELAAKEHVFLPTQFANPDNSEAHRLHTAREALDQMPGNRVDAVVSGVGTGGTLVGLFQGLSDFGCSVTPVLARPIAQNPDAPANTEIECCSFTFSGRIPGVLDSMSEIFRRADLPGLVTLEIPDDEALETTRQLIRLGFPVGPSSGLNFAAARRISKRLKLANPAILTVFPDRMERYFSTELFQKK